MNKAAVKDLGEALIKAAERNQHEELHTLLHPEEELAYFNHAVNYREQKVGFSFHYASIIKFITFILAWY